MIGEQELASLASPLRPHPQPDGDAGTVALQDVSARLKAVQAGNSRFRTKDLVGLLLSHAARTWRNTQPAARIRLKTLAPNGHPAVRLSFQKP